MEELVHVGNLLLFASFAVVDILWLRALQILASVAFIGYFVALDRTAPIAWNLAFIVINLGHSLRLLHQRRPVALTPEQERVYLRVFRSLTRREFFTLLGRGEWREVGSGDVLVTQGRPLAELLLLTEGRVAVVVGVDEVARLGPGNFVGEMSFFTKHLPTADVQALSRARMIAWPVEPLRRFLDAQPELRAKLERIIGADVIDKVRASQTGAALTLVRSTDGELRI
ncbi:MAG: cyclic nucleotide-binding domain-containing protein [Nannocystaceae bacterium]